MLHNPKWDVYSVQGLTAWLKEQNPKKRYNWHNINENGCLLSKYLHAMGEDEINYTKMQNVSCKIASTKPWNFGAALKRCNAQLENQNVV